MFISGSVLVETHHSCTDCESELLFATYYRRYIYGSMNDVGFTILTLSTLTTGLSFTSTDNLFTPSDLVSHDLYGFIQREVSSNVTQFCLSFLHNHLNPCQLFIIY